MSERLRLAEKEVIEHDQITSAAVAHVILVSAERCLPAGDDDSGYERVLDAHPDERLPAAVAAHRGVILAQALPVGREELERRRTHTVDVGEDHPETRHGCRNAAPGHSEGHFGDLTTDGCKGL